MYASRTHNPPIGLTGVYALRGFCYTPQPGVGVVPEAGARAGGAVERARVGRARGTLTAQSMHYERAPASEDRSWRWRRLRCAALCRASLRYGGARE